MLRARVGSGAMRHCPGTEERWVHIIGFADAPTPAVAQPRKASSGQRQRAGECASSAEGRRPLWLRAFGETSHPDEEEEEHEEEDGVFAAGGEYAPAENEGSDHR